MTVRGCLYESRDRMTSWKGRQTRSEDYSHFFINMFLRLSRDVLHAIPARRDPACSVRHPGIAGAKLSM